MKCPYINPTYKECCKCPFDECVKDDLSLGDYKNSNEFDKEIKIEGIDKKILRKREIDNNYRNNHLEIEREKDRQRYIGNRKDRVRDRNRSYYQEHKEELKERARLKYHLSKIDN